MLGLLARGHSTKEIGRRLVVSPKTAANHVEHIYAKLGVSSRAAATAVRHAARPDGCLRARPLTAVPSRAQAPCIACMFFVTAASTARSSPAGLIWRNSLPVVAEGVWPGGA